MKHVLLLGSPNSGKTTLYNWLTGSSHKTVNFPGSTVDYSVGALAPHWKSSFSTVDSPGVYSLSPQGADEEVTLRLLKSEDFLISAVIVVVDGTQIERHLQLALQVKALGIPFVVAVTMKDWLDKMKQPVRGSELSAALGAPVVFVHGLLGEGLQDLIAATDSLLNQTSAKKKQPPSWPDFAKIDWSSESVQLARQVSSAIDHKFLLAQTERWDRWFLHPVFGLLIFVVMMSLIFTSIFWAAKPLMDLVGFVFEQASDQVKIWGGDHLLTQFLADGVVAGFGAVWVFAPQIFILFLGIGWLESSGYLARASTLIDKPFSALGLTGRSFVPLLTGFSCAVPALMATRNLSSSRDRWITNFILPLMTCSARLPVYALLIAFLFPDQAFKAGLVLTGLYFFAVVVGALTASLLNRLLPRDQNSHLMMELPLYRKPRLGVLLKQSWDRTKSYLTRAGPVIFVLAVVLWTSSHFPQAENATPSEQLKQSYLGQVGTRIEPLFEPMGVDWRVGIGLLSAFAAREVFVSSLALTFQLPEGDEDSQQESLLQAMGQARFADGEPIFTGASVAALIVFFTIALQCLSTVGVQIRESSWGMAVSQLLIFNVVAYFLAVATFQLLRV